MYNVFLQASGHHPTPLLRFSDHSDSATRYAHLYRAYRPRHARHRAAPAQRRDVAEIPRHPARCWFFFWAIGVQTWFRKDILSQFQHHQYIITISRLSCLDFLSSQCTGLNNNRVTDTHQAFKPQAQRLDRPLQETMFERLSPRKRRDPGHRRAGGCRQNRAVQGAVWCQ